MCIFVKIFSSFSMLRRDKGPIPREFLVQTLSQGIYWDNARLQRICKIKVWKIAVHPASRGD